MEKQRIKEEQNKKLLEQRTQFIEKTRNLLVFDSVSEDKPKRSGGRVSSCLIYCDIMSDNVKCYEQTDIKFSMFSM